MDSYLPLSIIGIIVLVTLVPFWAYTFYRRRDHRIVKARNYIMVLLCSLILDVWLISLLVLTIVDPTSYKCLWGVVNTSVSMGSACVMYYIRLLDLTAALRMNYDKNQGKGYKPSFFTRNRWIRSKYFLVSLFIVMEGCICIPLFSFEAIVGVSPSEECAVFEDELSTYLIIVWLILVISTYVFFAWGYNEQFFIKTELAWASLCSFLTLLFWIIIRNTSALYDWTQDNYRYLEYQVHILTCIPILYLLLIFPLREAKKLRVRVDQEKRPSFLHKYSFRKLLKHPVFYSTFRLFLVEEWSVENILFLQEIEDIEEKVINGSQEQKSQDEEEKQPLIIQLNAITITQDNTNISLKQMLFNLKDKFLNEGSLHEINIGSTQQDHLNAQLDEILATFSDNESELVHAMQTQKPFETAKKAIFTMLEGGAFLRFIRSDKFKQIQASISLDELERLDDDEPASELVELTTQVAH